MRTCNQPMQGCFCWDGALNEKLFAGTLKFLSVGLITKTSSYKKSGSMPEEEHLLTLSSRRAVQRRCREAEPNVWVECLLR